MTRPLHSCVLSSFLVVGFLQLPTAIRLSEDVDTTAQCQSKVTDIFQTITFRDLFSPFPDGTYRIRNRFSGKYLTAAENGYAGTSLHHYGSSKMSDWVVKRVQDKKGMPVYTLKNRDSGLYLDFKHSEAPSTGVASDAMQSDQWSLRLTTDGVHRVIHRVASAVAVNTNGTVKLETIDSIDEEEVDSLKSQWVFEWRASWWRRPQGNHAGYTNDWASVSEIPLWPGTERTWKEMGDDAPMDFSAGYADQRHGLVSIGVLSETHRRYTTENRLSGPCDMNWAQMLFMFAYAPETLSELRKSAGDSCEGKSLKEMSAILKESMVDQCFRTCLNSIHVHIKNYVDKFNCARPNNKTEFWDNVVANTDCKDAWPEHLEKMTHYALMTKCMIWHPPSLLWTSELHGAHSLAHEDGDAVCSIPDSNSRSSSDIAQNGQCPAGTTCQCPGTFVRERASTLELEEGGLDHMKNLGSALPSVLGSGSSSLGRSFLIGVLVRGQTIAQIAGGLHLSPAYAPFFLLRWGRWLGKAISWRCANTVGCWPAQPERSKHGGRACRMEEAAEFGGSPVWFLPPPGVMVRNRKWYNIGRRCEFATCAEEDLMTPKPKIGFEGDNVYNCQVLTFAEMTDEQKRLYVEKIRETLPKDEYPNELPM